MDKGEIKAVGKERFMNDPVQFGSLMAFQYGEGDEYEQASSRLFSSSVEGTTVKSLEELKC